jgi:hypothetical protein
MPVLDGFAAAAEIRRLRLQTEQLLHTGLLVSEHRHRAQALGLTVLDKLEHPHDRDSCRRVGLVPSIH